MSDKSLTPSTLFHLTRVGSIESIFKFGLMPAHPNVGIATRHRKEDLNKLPRVFLTDDPYFICFRQIGSKFLKSEKWALLQVDTNHLHIEPFMTTNRIDNRIIPNEYWCPHTIEPERLKRISLSSIYDLKTKNSDDDPWLDEPWTKEELESFENLEHAEEWK